MQAKAGRFKPGLRFWRVLGLGLLLFAVAGAVVAHRLRQRLPHELMQDIRAGIAARHIKDAGQRYEKFLEIRYGPQSDPANREKAFLDFFNPDHIRALQLLVRHSPPGMRQANIDATADWVRHFRESLTPPQRANLIAQMQADGGNGLLQQATAQYNRQDVWYRGQTAPVVSELLKTVASLQNH